MRRAMTAALAGLLMVVAAGCKLLPSDTWSDGAAYDAQAKKLAEMFRRNFEKFGSNIAPAIAEAGPRA